MHLSHLTVRLLSGFAIFIIPVIVISLFLVSHYQDKVVSLKRQMFEDKQMFEQKEQLVSRLAQLERSLSNTEQNLNTLEGRLDFELGSIKTGLGPIQQEITEFVLTAPPTEIPSDGVYLEEEGVTLTTVQEEMERLDVREANLKSQIEEIYDVHDDILRYLDATPKNLPLPGWVTSGFGMRRSPYSHIRKMHYGLDIAAPIGTSIQAPAAGVILLAEFRGGYGRKVIIDHGYGICTVYAHASKLYVKEGETVERGDIIGEVGSSGASTGPHLHYEIHVDGIPTDPITFITK